MKRISADSDKLIESYVLPNKEKSLLSVEPVWREIIEVLLPKSKEVPLRPVQHLALARHKILQNRRHLIVAAPTGSGKSLLGYLILLEAIKFGKRAVWLSPLKALAREKAEEIKNVLPQLEKILRKKISIHLTTGDYRIEHELFTAPPPSRAADAPTAQNDIVIATPERMEAVLRNPQYQNWFSSIGAVCVDEAHLLSDSRRGITLEYLLTSLLVQSPLLAAGGGVPPRIILLSASVGNTERAERWLSPSETIRFSQRIPPLLKEVWQLSADEEKDQVILRWLEGEVLPGAGSQAIIFVYQTRSAEKLAKLISEKLKVNAEAFHSRISSDTREQIRQNFVHGESRILVATTALALGINLPATHVLVRDTIFPGAKALTPAELLQMMGRAGRGESAGRAVVTVKDSDYQNSHTSFTAEKLVEDLRAENLPELSSAFAGARYQNRYSADLTTDKQIVPLAEIVAALLARNSNYGLTFYEIQTFFAHSFGAARVAEKLPAALDWLKASERVLANENKEDAKIKLTSLGQFAVGAVLPLPIAGGFGQLVRDLLTIDPKDEFLNDWQMLDHLFVLQLFSSKNAGRKFSSKLVEQIDAWMERNPKEVPVLYREWIRGTAETSRVAELFGSLGITSALNADSGNNQSKQPALTPYRIAYLGLLRAILLWERGRGMPVEDIERNWQIENLSGVEESWRDEMLWLLSASLAIWEVKAFYYHLKEECRGGERRIKLLGQMFRKQKQQIYALLSHLTYCSPLGALLRQLKSGSESSARLRGIGITSIRKLEQSGIQSLAGLLPLSEKELIQLGIGRAAAVKLRNYLRRRLM